ncbi:cbb3-type cytochrome oxidase assembly protein [Blattabacterium cuenoti]
MILSSVSLGGFFLILFLISLFYGKQFDDFDSPKMRILMEDE